MVDGFYYLQHCKLIVKKQPVLIIQSLPKNRHKCVLIYRDHMFQTWYPMCICFNKSWFRLQRKGFDMEPINRTFRGCKFNFMDHLLNLELGRDDGMLQIDHNAVSVRMPLDGSRRLQKSPVMLMTAVKHWNLAACHHIGTHGKIFVFFCTCASSQKVSFFFAFENSANNCF